MAKIDIDKFVASIFKCCEEHGKDIPIAYSKALKDQGLKYDVNKKEIVSFSEPEQPTLELTDFEKVLAECIDNAQCSVLNAEGIAVSWSDALMKEARKQIADSIDVNAMVVRQSEYDYDYGLSDEDADFMLRGYRLGIEEVIEKIKGEL